MKVKNLDQKRFACLLALSFLFLPKASFADSDGPNAPGELMATGTIVFAIGTASPTNATLYAGLATTGAGLLLGYAQQLSQSPLQKETADFMVKASKDPSVKADSPILVQAIAEKKQKLLAQNVKAEEMSDAAILSYGSAGSAN